MNQNLTCLNLNPLAPGNIHAYCQQVLQIPVLSAEQEHELALQWAERQDKNAAKQLILSHLRFVVHFAKGYRGYGLADADLIQEGNIGLMKAVKRFNPKKGVRLITYAVHWIKSQIHDFVIKNWRIVTVATTKAQRKLFFNLRRNKKQLGWFTREEADSVAKTLGVSRADIHEMERRLSAVDPAFDAPSATEVEQESPAQLAPEHTLADTAADPARHFEQHCQHSAGEQLKAQLAHLPERERHIITARWLTDPKVTLTTLASHYGISVERVRQLEKQAIQKLKALIGDAS